MEIYAYFLPQFHEIKENNEWWGKGFTEWTNVKKAKPLFKNHNQPRVPLNDFYYDLSDVKTLEWQTKLAKKYGIDGFVFYHYYFCGKKLLEKPAEMLLENTNIDIGFYFCWANHDWNRAWKNSREILMKQEYGNVEQWEEHYKYLLSFFKDERYKKIENKPVFMIYNPIFSQKKDIIKYFDERCKQDGFDGIYIIEVINGMLPVSKFSESVCELTSSIHRREPDYSLNMYKKNRNILSKFSEKTKRLLSEFNIPFLVRKYDANDIYKYMMQNELIMEKEVIPGLFFEWDNTSRHSFRGFIIKPVKKEVFIEYMNFLKSKNTPVVLLNAWNEWCEGMYLEPDKKNGFKFLEYINDWKNNINN